MGIKQFGFAVLLAFTIFMGCGTAQAFLGKDKIPALNNEVKLTPEEFEDQTDLIDETPLDNKTFSYEVRLPKKWMKQPIVSLPSGENILSTVSEYQSPPRLDQPSIFRVSSVEIKSFITADDWLVSYMLEMGFSIQKMTIESENLVWAQYSVFENGEPYIVRATVAVRGKKIILAEYLLHQDVYVDERDMQILSMNGFKFTDDKDIPPIDAKTFNFVDIAQFDYPSNWTIISPHISDITRMEASVLNTLYANGDVKNSNFEFVGRIDLSLVTKDQGLTLADEINLLKQTIEERGYKLGKFIETVSVDGLSPLILSSRVDAYEVEGVTKRIAGYEYWVAVLQSKSRYYILRLTTVSRSDDFRKWAENVQTFKHLMRSLRPASVVNAN